MRASRRALEGLAEGDLHHRDVALSPQRTRPGPSGSRRPRRWSPTKSWCCSRRAPSSGIDIGSSSTRLARDASRAMRSPLRTRVEQLAQRRGESSSCSSLEVAARRTRGRVRAVACGHVATRCSLVTHCPCSSVGDAESAVESRRALARLVVADRARRHDVDPVEVGEDEESLVAAGRDDVVHRRASSRRRGRAAPSSRGRSRARARRTRRGRARRR